MTTANTTAQLATFLNVAPNAIKSVTEMAWVFCVVVKGCRARFVSKKVVKEVVEVDYIAQRVLARRAAEANSFFPSPVCTVEDIQDIEIDWYERETQMMHELNQALPINNCVAEYVLSSWARKVLNNACTFEQAIAAMTSKKPVLRK